MESRLKSEDIAILELIQRNCKLTTREIAEKIGAPISTVFAKIKRMEEMGVIKDYRAILNSKKVDRGTTAFILASVSYGKKNDETSVPQRNLAEEIAKFPIVQEVHIITGDWDLLIKLKAENVDRVGTFVIDKLRPLQGLEKTLTSMVFETCKETTEITLQT